MEPGLRWGRSQCQRSLRYQLSGRASAESRARARKSGASCGTRASRCSTSPCASNNHRSRAKDHFSRPLCKRTVDSARERPASLACLSLECGLRGFVRLRRMLLSLALVWCLHSREQYARRFPNQLRGMFSTHKIKRLSEMARESQMTRPAKDTTSTFRQPLAFNRAQQGPTVRGREVGLWFDCVSGRRRK